MAFNGLCECGCGQLAPLAEGTRPGRGEIRGQPRRFIRGHNRSVWKGGRVVDALGYITVWTPNHPRRREYIAEHILVVERILGRYLPTTAIVHHVNGIKADNRPCNLVVCQDQSYHQLLHARERALAGCGHADWLKCLHCGQWDDPANLAPHGHVGTPRRRVHRRCANQYAHRRKAKGVVGQSLSA